MIESWGDDLGWILNLNVWVGKAELLWMPLGFIQDKEDSEWFSDFIYSFQTSLRCMVFSLTTAPLTDDPFSVSPSCHMHRDPYFWRLAHENLHTRDFTTCWIMVLNAALDLTLIYPDETRWWFVYTTVLFLCKAYPTFLISLTETSVSFSFYPKAHFWYILPPPHVSNTQE
jgi:hypothetical protein